MIAVAIVLIFLAVDFVVVLGALHWLSEQRATADITNLRFRERRRRYRL